MKRGLTRVDSLVIMQSNGDEGKKYGKITGTENPRLVQAGAVVPRNTFQSCQPEKTAYAGVRVGRVALVTAPG